MSSSRSLSRALIAPVRRLLDGRFADVNRRIGDARAAVETQDARIAKLTNELAAYSTTQNEATNYTGLELRRLADSLDVHEQRIATELGQLKDELDQLGTQAYVERLERASSGSLRDLDGPLAGAINLASGHRGFAAQAKLWFNPAVTVKLSEGRAAIANVNERVVELPFAFAQLGHLRPPARILDIGGAESTFGLSAASLGYQVTMLDPQGVPYEHPNLEGVSSRLEEWDPQGATFAAVFIISAIEHFGLGAYGENVTAGERADLGALERVRELLDEDGLLVLTTPYGVASVDQLERVYDDAGLQELLAGWEVLERQVFSRANRRTWQPGTGGSAGAVLLTATPLRKL